MRALVVAPGPEFLVADVHAGWCKGLAQVGVDVKSYNLNDRLAFYSAAHIPIDGEYQKVFDQPAAVRLALMGLEAACYEFNPDVVVFISGFFVDTPIIDVMRAHGHKIVLVHTESPYEDDKQLARAPLADLNILNDPTNLEQFRLVAPTIYLPHCYDPGVHYPRAATRGMESEFFFAGTGYPSRVEFFERVDWSGIDVSFAGNWPDVKPDSPLAPFIIGGYGECMDNSITALHYASTLTSCNLYRTESERPALSEGWACGPREIELAACGTWFARQGRGESNALLPMLPTFSTPEELGEVIRWAIGHPEERERAARLASAAVADRTFDNNARRALQEIEALP